MLQRHLEPVFPRRHSEHMAVLTLPSLPLLVPPFSFFICSVVVLGLLLTALFPVSHKISLCCKGCSFWTTMEMHGGERPTEMWTDTESTDRKVG